MRRSSPPTPAVPVLLLLACTENVASPVAAVERTILPLDRPGLTVEIGPDGARLTGEAEIVVRTTAWGRGPDLVDAPVPTLPFGATRPARGDLIAEWWRTVPFGVEQGWTITAPLAGEGDLAIHVTLDGVDDLAPSDGGARFADASGRAWTVSPPTAWDARGVALPARLVAEDDGLVVHVDDTDATYPIVIDPVYSTPSQSLYLSFDVRWGDIGTAAAADMNDDGYDDVVIGVRATDGGLLFYKGSATGVPDEPTYTFNTEGSLSVGSAIALGDLDCDGKLDVLTGGSRGAKVYRGNGAAQIASSTPFLSVAGSSTTYLGTSVAAADVDGDGCDEAIVGAWATSSERGAAYVYDGGSSTPVATINGVSAGDEMGRAVGTVGDFNGDGYEDVQLGAKEGTSGLYLGSASGLSTTRARTFECGWCGTDLVPVGDLNADGFDDMVSGDESWYWDSGTFTVTYGAATGTGGTTTVEGTWGSELGGHWAGGDFDGDGYADLVVDLARYQQNIYPGSAAGIATAPVQEVGVYSIATGNHARTGDVNGDGFDDLLYIVPSSGVHIYHGGLDADGDGVIAGEDCNDSDATASVAGTRYADEDGDGYGDAAVSVVSCGGDGTVADATDCDDTLPGVNPGATEVPADGVDSDCDGAERCYQDVDSDGYGSTTTVSSADLTCATAGVSTRSTDCDDGDAREVPGGADTLGDGLDGDCDGVETCYADLDADGARGTDTVTSDDADCADAGEALATAAIDCDEADEAIRPGAAEITGDGVDQDCDDAEVCYANEDGDGARAASILPSADIDCADAGEALATAVVDCDDARADVHPGGTEATGDELDSDCDGGEDCYVDGDGDGYRTPDLGTVVSADADCADAGEGRADDPATDCDDTDAGANPGAAEVAGDRHDADCDGLDRCYVDADGDGARTEDTVVGSTLVCSGPGEALADAALDCDDTASAVHPGASEIVGDDVDGDCDGGERCFVDADDDGYRVEGEVTSADPDCTDPGEAAAGEPTGDCADEDATIHPAADEVTGDRVDQDCDGVERCFVDADADGWRGDTEVAALTLDCTGAGEAALTTPAGDCDDADADVNPAGDEAPADGLDADCDGNEVCYVDADGDGHRPDATTTTTGTLDCAGVGEAGGDAPADDCDDGDATVHGGATDTVDDDIDQDCDGTDATRPSVDDDPDGGDADKDGGTACAVTTPGAGWLLIGVGLGAVVRRRSTRRGR